MTVIIAGNTGIASTDDSHESSVALTIFSKEVNIFLPAMRFSYNLKNAVKVLSLGHNLYSYVAPSNT